MLSKETFHKRDDQRVSLFLKMLIVKIKLKLNSYENQIQVITYALVDSIFFCSVFSKANFYFTEILPMKRLRIRIIS
jgi:hypothetical protein